MREHTGGIGRYQFLAGCNIFRHKEVNREGDRIAAEEFVRVVEYKFGMKLELDEVLSLFHFLVPGTGESIEIAEMVRPCFCFCFCLREAFHGRGCNFVAFLLSDPKKFSLTEPTSYPNTWPVESDMLV